MEPKSRFAAMGKFAYMLTSVKNKINKNDLTRDWDHTPKMDFIFRRHHFNDTGSTQQPTQEQVQPSPDEAQAPIQPSPDEAKTPDSSYDQDCQLLEPEQYSIDESYSDSDASDLKESIQGVNSINQILQDHCTELLCINMNMSAQCSDPVHTQQTFAPQASSTPAAGHQQQPDIIMVGQSGGEGRDPMLSQTRHAPQPMLPPQPMVGGGGSMPTPSANVQTIEPPVFDPVNLTYWIRFNENIHTQVGPNKMKIKSNDPNTGFPTERTCNVIYKSYQRKLFQTTKNLKSSEVWIQNSTCFEAYSVNFDMTPSRSDLLSETNYLDSYIEDNSGLRKVLQELSKHSPELTRRFISHTIDVIFTYFDQQCSLFNAHAYINFTSGFTLSNKLYALFVQDKVCSSDNFEKQVGALQGQYPAKAELKEREIHQESPPTNLHTISTVHLQEHFVQHVELVPEKEREKARLHPKTGQGIAKRMLVNVKVDTLYWMQAKMELRKSLLPNHNNPYVRELLNSSLWDPEIFPDEDMAKMRATANSLGRSMESLLSIQSSKRNATTMQVASCSSDPTPRVYESPLKRHKPQHMATATHTQPKSYHKKRGSRAGRKHKNRSNNNNRQQHNKQKKGNNQGNSFHKGKKESNK